MIPYKNTITIFDKNDILLHLKKGSSSYINKYIEDERRHQFPYSNIPMHCCRVGGKKINYINHLMDFEEPYVRISDEYILQSFAIKDGNEALLINQTFPIIETTIEVSRAELEELFRQPTGKNEHLYLMKLDGSLYNSYLEKILPSEDQILQSVQKHTIKELEYYFNMPTYFSNNTKEILRNCVKNLTIENLPTNYQFTADDIILVRLDGNNISIQSISIRLMGKDKYKLDIINLPITKYTLEQLKYLGHKIETTTEPKISRSLNPEITKEDIEQAKKMIKMKNN